MGIDGETESFNQIMKMEMNTELWNRLNPVSKFFFMLSGLFADIAFRLSGMSPKL